MEIRTCYYEISLKKIIYEQISLKNKENQVINEDSILEAQENGC